MNKNWYSYLMLGIGLIMFGASDKNSIADDKQTAHQITYGTDKRVEVFVNKNGAKASLVNIKIDGKEYKFTLPKLGEDESTVITSDDGEKIIIKMVSGDTMVIIDGDELLLPALGRHMLDADGLSAMIGSSMQIDLSDDVTISAHDLSDDLKAALIEAVKGVLTSYDVDKKVTFSDNKMKLHLLGHDSGSDFEFLIKNDSSTDGNHVIFIKTKELHLETDDK